eukprot:Lankesteria_metandrocarpae@DN10534_c0_g1_i1.p1
MSFELHPPTAHRRRVLYEAATTYAHQQAPEYREILNAATVTDPLGVDLEVVQRPTDTQLIKTDRIKWGSRSMYFFTAYCNASALGSIATCLWVAPGFSDTIFNTIFGLITVFVFLSVEVALGQLFQGSPVKVFALLNKRSRAVGFAAVILISLQVPITSRFLGEQLLYFGQSFSRTLPWQVSPDMISQCLNLTVADGSCDGVPWCTSCDGSAICYGAYYRYAHIHAEKTLVGLAGSDDVVSFNPQLVATTMAGILIAYLLALTGLRPLGQ